MTVAVTEERADRLEAKQLLREAYDLRRTHDILQARNLERLAYRILARYDA